MKTTRKEKYYYKVIGESILVQQVRENLKSKGEWNLHEENREDNDFCPGLTNCQHIILTIEERE